MNTNLPPDGHAATRPGRPSRLWAGMALLLALVAIAGVTWSLYELRRLSDRERNLDLELRQASQRLETAVRESGRLRAELRQLADHDAGMDRALAETRATLNQLARSEANVDFALAEAEYLLILAEQRLTLMHDAETAKAALQAVDNRLAGLQAPGLDAVRGQVNADLLRLAQVPGIDYNRWMGELGALAAAAESLPLRSGVQADGAAAANAGAAPEGWRGFLHAVWRELRDTVVITRTASEVAPLPAERHLLVQNFLLRIETARLALLRRDTATLRDAAASCADWLRRWFDGGNAQVRSALQLLQELSRLDPDASLPDIASSLETLRALTRERAAPAAPEPVPAPAP